MARTPFFTAIQDRMNPIAVKEMRQAVKGRTIIWAFLFFLIIQLVIIGAVLVLHENIQSDFNVGRGIFSGLLGVLMAVCMLLLPAYAGFRISSERSENNVDLFFITTLKPTSIIFGKSFASAALTILFFSASLPFMTLTYLLRGLDVPSMLILLALDFLIVIASIQFGIFMGCLPGGLMSRIVRGLIGLGILMSIFQTTMVISLSLLFHGVGSSFGTWEFWSKALTIAAFILLGTGMLFILSVTVITPKSANRAVGMRIYLFIVWIVTAFIFGLWAVSTRDEDTVLFWMIAITILLCINLFVSVSERLDWGPRVKRQIPRNVFIRIFTFPFFSGASGGLIYSVILIAATILVTFSSVNSGFFGKLDNDATHAFMVGVSVGLYTFCYALTALTIRRIFFRNSTRADITGLIITLLIVAGTVIPTMVGFMLRTQSWRRLSPMWFIGNPFVVVGWKEMWPACLAFSGIWAVCVIAVTLPWLISQFRSFRPVLTDTPQKSQVQNNE
ncbi:MAG: hypothetical protein JW749_13025 [Sedimentisphaerales bacterium]|nr:hypothetical protein [Sedimentisphaerales bacterium]